MKFFIKINFRPLLKYAEMCQRIQRKMLRALTPYFTSVYICGHRTDRIFSHGNNILNYSFKLYSFLISEHNVKCVNLNLKKYFVLINKSEG